MEKRKGKEKELEQNTQSVQWLGFHASMGSGLSPGPMARQHHQLNGHEFEQTPGDSEGQGSLVFLTNDYGQGE